MSSLDLELEVHIRRAHAAIGATVEEAYLVLVDTTIIVYFIPYLYLFLALPVIRRRRIGAESTKFAIPGGRLGIGLVAVSGFATTAFSIVLATLPTDVAGNPFWFFVKVVGGAGGLMALGLVFYAFAARKKQAVRKNAGGHLERWPPGTRGSGAGLATCAFACGRSPPDRLHPRPAAAAW